MSRAVKMRSASAAALKLKWYANKLGAALHRSRKDKAVRSGIYDGFIFKGSKSGGRVRVDVVDLPAMLQLVGEPVTSWLFSPAWNQFGVQAALPNRDPLQQASAGAPYNTFDSPESLRGGAIGRNVLFGRPDGITRSDVRIGAAVQLDSGVWVVSATTLVGDLGSLDDTLPARIVDGLVGDTDYSQNSPQCYVAAIYGAGESVIPSGDGNGVMEPRPPAWAPRYFGLDVYPSGLSPRIPAGWALIPTLTLEQWEYDWNDWLLFNWRAAAFAPPFIHAAPLELLEDSATWRVASVIVRQAHPDDLWGERALLLIDVSVSIDREAKAAQASITRSWVYAPTNSYDPAKRPVADEDGLMYGANGFLAPAMAVNGAMFFTARTNTLGPSFSNHLYWGLLVTAAGAAVEVDFPNTSRGSFSDDPTTIGFFGTDAVEGRCWFLNPFCGDNQMVIVGADDGSVQTVEAPTWWPATPTSRERIPHTTNRAVHIGNGILAFPARATQDGELLLGTWNTASGALEARGAVWEGQAKETSRGVAVTCVKRESEDGGDAVLLMSASGRQGTTVIDVSGATYISYDSGYTWTQLLFIGGGSRGASPAGNDLYFPLPGAFK